MKPGDQVTVSVQPAWSGKPVGRITDLILPGGKKFVAYRGAHTASSTEGNALRQ